MDGGNENYRLAVKVYDAIGEDNNADFTVKLALHGFQGGLNVNIAFLRFSV